MLLASSDPAEVLRGPVPRLLDEWQNAPNLWNRVRRECDDRPGSGQFILTGSAVPQDDVTRHTGTGRISRVLLRPMSLWETGQSTGAASLKPGSTGGVNHAGFGRGWWSLGLVEACCWIHAAGDCWCRASNSTGVSMLSDVCRRWRLCQISRYSNMALASSIRVRQRCRSKSSTCMRDQNDSIIALSKQSPIEPIDGTRPESSARRVKAHEVNWPDSIGGRNAGLLEGV